MALHHLATFGWKHVHTHTHTHSTPCLCRLIPNMLAHASSSPLPHSERVKRKLIWNYNVFVVHCRAGVQVAKLINISASFSRDMRPHTPLERAACIICFVGTRGEMLQQCNEFLLQRRPAAGNYYAAFMPTEEMRRYYCKTIVVRFAARPPPAVSAATVCACA